MVLNKYADLTIKNSSDFKKYRKPAAEIKKTKVSIEPKKKKIPKLFFSYQKKYCEMVTLLL